MDVPGNTDNVAWFNLGTLPGGEGSAVIAGHFDNESGGEAVFYNLKTLNIDDKVLVEDNEGNIFTFLVKEVRLYDSEAFAPEVFISSEGKRLNLITCAGNWHESEERYEQRLIIFTEIFKEN